MDVAKTPGFFERLFSRFSGDTPDSVASVKDYLRAALASGVLDAETLQKMENILEFSSATVRDVMITRSQMDVVKAADSPERIMAYIIETAHSRFPVIGEDKDSVLGILHAKDLLKYWARPEQFQLEQVLREAVFVPESKALAGLLKDFREQRHHMAIVVDEYGGTSGLVTFEDVLEQIIGDIEDEFDDEDGTEDNIVCVSPGRFRVNAVTEIDDLNQFFGTQFSDEEVDTAGGLVMSKLGHLPVRGEKVLIDHLLFTVARADNRRLHTLMVTVQKDE